MNRRLIAQNFIKRNLSNQMYFDGPDGAGDDDSFKRNKVLGDVTASLIHGVNDKTDVEYLRGHPGKAMTQLNLLAPNYLKRAHSLGIDGDQAIKLAYAQYVKGCSLCESPIERSMLAALIMGRWPCLTSIPPLVHNSSDKNEMFPGGDIVIIPQMAFLRYRFDFGIVFEFEGTTEILCVECDGKEYHKDADKMRERNAYMVSWGIPTLRFTGSYLNTNAAGAVEIVVTQATKWHAEIMARV